MLAGLRPRGLRAASVGLRSFADRAAGHLPFAEAVEFVANGLNRGCDDRCIVHQSDGPEHIRDQVEGEHEISNGARHHHQGRPRDALI